MSTGVYAPAATGTVFLAGAYSGPLANLVPAAGGILMVASNTTPGTLNVAGGAFYATNNSSFGPATLSLNGGSLGATTAVTVPNALVWSSTSGGTLNFAGNAKLALSAPLGLPTNGATYNINDPGTVGTLSGVISGPGSLNITGYPTLAGANTYQGTTTFNNNTNATVTNNQALGTGTIIYNNGGFNASTPLTGANAIANPWQITAGQTAYFNGNNGGNGQQMPYELSGSTTLPAGNSYIQILNNYQNLKVTLSGLISGGTGATLVRSGAGNNNNNSINGTIVINNPLNSFGAFILSTQGGNIDVGSASSQPSGATGSSITSGPLGTGNIQIGDTNWNDSMGLLNSSPVAATLGNSVQIYDSAAYWSASGLTLSGPVSLLGRGQNIGTVSGQQNVYNGVINFYLGNNLAANGNNNTFANSNVTISGVISGTTITTGALNYPSGINLGSGSGAGGLTLAGNNTYAGPTSISYGTLIAGNSAPVNGAGAFGNASSPITIGDGNSGNKPAALVTNGPWEIDRAIVVNANAGPTTIGDIGANDAQSGGSYWTGPITLNNSVTLTAAANGLAWFSSDISGSGGITAASALTGNVTLSPTSTFTYTGATTVSSGQLTLDYTDLNQYYIGSPVINPASQLILSGGTLTFNGDQSNTLNQAFYQTTIVTGFGSMVTAANGGQAVNVNMQAITRNGGVLDLAVNAASFTTTSNNTNGIMGGYMTVNGYTDWASVDNSGTIVPLATVPGGYTNDTASSFSDSTANLLVVTGGVAGHGGPFGGVANSLNFSSSSAASLVLPGQLTLTTGGILVTPSVGTKSLAINGGSLTTVGPGAGGTNTANDVVVIQGNPNAAFAIGSVITDNGNPVGLTMGGQGLLVLNGVNTYSGPTTVCGGTLQGSLAAGNFGNTSAIAINYGANVTFNESGSTTTTIAISGGGSITKAGAGQLGLSAASTLSGGATLNAGTLLLANASGSALGSSNLTFNGGILATPPGTAGAMTGSVVAGTGNNYITPGGDGSIGSLGVGGLVLSNLSTMRFDISSTSSFDQIKDSGALGFSSASGAATLQVPSALGSGTYPLISFGSTALANAGDFSLALIGGGTVPGSYSLLMNSGNSQLDLVVASAVTPSGGTWNFNGNGSWADSSKWSPAAVPSSGTVTFAGVPGQPTAPITVTLDGNESAEGLVFNVSGSGYTLAQGTGGALTLGTTAGGSVSVLSGTHTISAPIVLAGGLAVNAAGTGALDLSGNVSEATPRSARSSLTAGS